MPSITIQNTPIEDLGLVLVGGGPALSGLNAQREYLAWPGHAGGFLSSVAQTDARVLRFELQTGHRITSVTERAAALDRFADLLTGPVEIVFYSDVPRKIVGQYRTNEANALRPSFLTPHAALVVEFECANATLMDLEPSHLVLSSTPGRVPVGTAGHGGRVTITGPNTTPFTITYRNVAGAALGAVAVAPNLATGEWMLIDFDTEEILKINSSNVVSDVSSWLTSATWFSVMPRDANRDMSAWPTIESSVAALYEYRRNWVTA